jgi:hypothetical protein
MTRQFAPFALLILAACASDKAGVAAPTAGPACAGSDRLGCANAANLRMMVADPRDLGRGVDGSTTSDEAAIAAVRDYRLGEPQRPASPSADANRTEED